MLSLRLDTQILCKIYLTSSLTLQGWLVRFLTQTYAAKQADAGDEVGVSQGEAWRVAMEEAAKAGARQVSFKNSTNVVIHAHAFLMNFCLEVLSWTGGLIYCLSTVFMEMGLFVCPVQLMYVVSNSVAHADRVRPLFSRSSSSGLLTRGCLALEQLAQSA